MKRARDGRFLRAVICPAALLACLSAPLRLSADIGDVLLSRPAALADGTVRAAVRNADGTWRPVAQIWDA